MSASAQFDFTQLLPAGLPAPAAKWTGLAKYSFVGGNNDPDGVPVEGLIDAVNAVLKREGRTLATYGLANGPQGYRPLRDFISVKLKRDAGIACTADDILIVSGSLQALDLVNHSLLARGDTVIIEQETYQGSLNRLTRLGVNAVGIPLDQDGMRIDALASALADLKGRGITPKYIYTIPTVQNPTGTILPEARRAELLRNPSRMLVQVGGDDLGRSSAAQHRHDEGADRAASDHERTATGDRVRPAHGMPGDRGRLRQSGVPEGEPFRKGPKHPRGEVHEPGERTLPVRKVCSTSQIGGAG